MILVTGGAGYIGSHTCVELLNAGYNVVVVDNFCNSQPESLIRVQQITGKKLTLINEDICNTTALEDILTKYACQAVIHFAGLKAVGESVQKPLEYYTNNVVGTHSLLLAMQRTHVKNIVFSSSATVYGDPQFLPYTEEHPLNPTSPYGNTKRIVEDMLRDFSIAHKDWGIGILRYFNPVGAHPSGLIGENPLGIPNNLMPYISQVAVGRLSTLQIFGGDYPTEDGTGVRDYIHVVDLALGHLAALRYLNDNKGLLTVNLGSGKGNSVLELVAAFEKESGVTIAKRIVERRAGDIAEFYADASQAKQLLNWQTTLDINAMCADTWRWQQKNPKGYV